MVFLTISAEITIKGQSNYRPEDGLDANRPPLYAPHAPVAPVSPPHLGARPALQTQNARPGAKRVRAGQVTPLRACLGKPLDLRNLLGDDAADVLRLGHHAIRPKEAVVAARVANRGDIFAAQEKTFLG